MSKEFSKGAVARDPAKTRVPVRNEGMSKSAVGSHLISAHEMADRSYFITIIWTVIGLILCEREGVLFLEVVSK